MLSNTQPQIHYKNCNILMSTSASFISSKLLYNLRSISTNSFTAKPRRIRRAEVGAITKAPEAAQLKQNWLDSLTCCPTKTPDDSQWVLGIDPDLSGALAVLKPDHAQAQVFDSPYLPVLVGGKVRKRLDAKSIVLLLRDLDAPPGTTAYIEQSIPYPKDGKQGWWSGGFGYGLWIGILVASGFSVVPVPSAMWKNEFELSGGTCTKDDSRRVATTLFPTLSPLLKRKKDHGRAEALLIAAYGKGLKVDSLDLSDELVP